MPLSDADVFAQLSGMLDGEFADFLVRLGIADRDRAHLSGPSAPRAVHATELLRLYRDASRRARLEGALRSYDDPYACHTLLDALGTLNFKSQIDCFLDYVEQGSPHGAFVIHGPSAEAPGGHHWLLRRLLTLLEQRGQGTQLAHHCGSQALAATWDTVLRSLANGCRILPGQLRALGPAQLRQQVEEALVKRSHQGPLWISLERIDLLSPEHQRELLALWRGVCARLQGATRALQIVLFLVSDGACAPEGPLQAQGDAARPWQPGVPILLPPVGSFPREELVHWRGELRRRSALPGGLSEQALEKIFADSLGAPRDVAYALCEHCAGPDPDRYGHYVDKVIERWLSVRA